MPMQLQASMAELPRMEYDLPLPRWAQPWSPPESPSQAVGGGRAPGLPLTPGHLIFWAATTEPRGWRPSGLFSKLGWLCHAWPHGPTLCRPNVLEEKLTLFTYS